MVEACPKKVMAKARVDFSHAAAGPSTFVS